MKNRYISPFLCLLLILVSCGDDDEPALPHEIGTWDLSNYTVLNVPSDYSASEGREYELDILTVAGVTLASYSLDMRNDGNYSKEIEAENGASTTEEGTWELEGELLSLTSELGTERWDVQQNEGDQLWLSIPTNFPLIPNNVADTLSAEYLSSLDSEGYQALFDQALVDLTFVFERR